MLQGKTVPKPVFQGLPNDQKNSMYCVSLLRGIIYPYWNVALTNLDLAVFFHYQMRKVLLTVPFSTLSI